jgi:GNAT superfamily N-acetyltransferase
MKEIFVKTAKESDAPAAIAALTTAFSSDPAVRWLYPDPHEYLAKFASFARAFGGKAFANNTAHIAGDHAAAALWLPPDVQPDEEALIHVLEESVSGEMRDQVFGVFEQMGEYHPQEPHWYLPLIGVDAPNQGRGYGSALLEHALAMCDRDQVPAYLESSNPRNIPLYQRHGFELIHTIRVGSCPPVFPMVRRPRNTNN